MNATASWYNTERVSQPGSAILTNWKAERVAARQSPQASTPVSKITTGTEMYDMMTGGMGFGGVGIPVTEQTAMAVGAVYACVGLIGSALASLPFHLYERTDSGRKRHDSDLWWLFNESPWGAWTSTAAWHHAVQSIALKGDGFWRIHRASPYTNAIEGFEPIHPDRVSVYRNGKQNLYLVVTLDGTVEPVAQADMLHFHGIGFDGFRSITPIRAALRPAAGIALAADEYAAAFFKNGARPDFAITSPNKVDLEQAQILRETWASRHQGVSNAHLPAVLTGGMKVEQLTMSMEDTQLVAIRNSSVEDIARILGVPPSMIGATGSTTVWGSGVEQFSIAFVRYTLGRYIDSITQEVNRKIWPRNRTYFAEFNRDALLDGDSKAQAEYFAKALGGPGAQGWMAVDEVRRLKNLPPMDEEWTSKVRKAADQKGTQPNINQESTDNAPDDKTAGA